MIDHPPDPHPLGKRLRLGAMLAALAAAVLLAGAFAFPFVSTTFEVRLRGQDYQKLLDAFNESMADQEQRRGPGNLFDQLGRGIRNMFKEQMTDELGKKLRDPEVVRRLNRELQVYAMQQGGITVGPKHLGQIIAELFRAREYLVGVAVVLFSVAFPALKILGCLLVAGGAFSRQRQARLARWVEQLSVWSAGDVFIAALAIVFFKAKSFSYAFHTEPGLHCYIASFVASAVAAWLLVRMLRAQRSGAPTALRAA